MVPGTVGVGGTRCIQCPSPPAATCKEGTARPPPVRVGCAPLPVHAWVVCLCMHGLRASACMGCVPLHAWAACLYMHGLHASACMGCVPLHALAACLCMHGLRASACMDCVRCGCIRCPMPHAPSMQQCPPTRCKSEWAEGEGCSLDKLCMRQVCLLLSGLHGGLLGSLLLPPIPALLVLCRCAIPYLRGERGTCCNQRRRCTHGRCVQTVRPARGR